MYTDSFIYCNILWSQQKPHSTQNLQYIHDEIKMFLYSMYCCDTPQKQPDIKKNTVIQICGHNNPHQVVQTLGEKDMIITLNQIDKIGGSLSGTLCVCDTIILKAA